MAFNISLAAEPVAHIGSFPITNSLLAMVIAAVVLIVIAQTIGRRVNDKPGKAQVVAELVIGWLLGLMDSVTQDHAKSKRFFPLIATIFFFILTMNWMGLLPIFGTIGFYEEHHGETVLIPFLRAGTADLNLTIAIALVSVVATQVFGIMALGFNEYRKKFFPLSKNPIDGFVGILEFISEFTKIISFSFRLFGNVFAGEVLLLVVASLVPLLVPVPFYFLELFVGFIQAFVFALLSLVFFTIATSSHTAHDDHQLSTKTH